MQEVREENKKLWDVVQTLMSNQTKLEQQYNELKSHVSSSQRCPSVDSSPRISTVPTHDLHDMNDDNQESIPRSNKRHGVEHEDAILPSLRKIKIETAQNTFLGNTKRITPPQSLPETSKKPRKFQPPLHKDDGEDIKCGMEVGLASPNSKKLVALGTIQKTDRKAKANDGQPLADYIEVLVTIVYKQTTLLPRAYGKIQSLGSAIARCIPWPRQNIICSDGNELHSKFSSSISQVTVNRRETPGPKGSTSKSDKANVGRLNKNLTENKSARRKVAKEKPKEPTSSQIVQSHTSNIHITTSRC